MCSNSLLSSFEIFILLRILSSLSENKKMRFWLKTLNDFNAATLKLIFIQRYGIQQSQLQTKTFARLTCFNWTQKKHCWRSFFPELPSDWMQFHSVILCIINFKIPTPGTGAKKFSFLYFILLVLQCTVRFFRNVESPLSFTFLLLIQILLVF